MERLFSQFVFGGACNKKVNRYIPLEEVREALDSDKIIDMVRAMALNDELYEYCGNIT